jgi:hypothetical protein
MTFTPPPPPEEKIQESNLLNEGAREWINLFLYNDQKTPFQKFISTMGEVM